MNADSHHANVYRGNKASEWPLLLLCFSELDSDEGSVLDSSFYATVQMKHC